MEYGFGCFAHFCESRTCGWPLSSLEFIHIAQAALFSAIVTSFLITALSNLGPDYQQQSALLLHQLLNGRDPGLASVSDPTAPFEPSGFAIAVNCLWFASLSASLGASFGAMICKEWLTEYNGGANPVVDLFQVCQRQVRFMAFQRWNVETLIGLLPPLLHSSVILFFTGAVIYLWQIDVRVAIVYIVIGGVFSIIYFLSTFLPIILNAPFRPYSTLLVLRLSVWIKNVIVLILDAIAHVCYVALRYVTAWILWPFARTIFSKGDLHTWYMKAWTILPAEYNHVRVRWAGASSDSLEKIDTSHRIQEEAILWLSQMPLDATQSKAVVSSLAQFSLSRPHRFPQSVVVFLNFTLESSFHKAPGQVQADVAIDCLLVLGRIKFQSVVDRNRDEDLNVGGIKVTTLVAWAAQQLIANASDDSFDTQPSEGTRARLLTAAAWLSPVEEVEEVTPYGEKLKIQDRWEFVEELRMTLAQHTCKEDSPIDNNIFIDLIHGMHACIPRGDYGSPSSIVSFLPLICNNYDSLWSEDESVLRALITYALDLLLPIKRRKPLVEREIEFNKLTSELIDVLKVDTTSPDVVAFGFWLIYRVPYAFKSRKSTLADIGYIWTSTNGVIPQDLRQRMNFHAVDALVAVVQHHASANRKLPNLAADDTLNLLTTALEDNCTQQMATYAVAMILYLGTSNQAASLATGLDAESFTKLLDTVPSDLEKGPTEEGVIEFYIHLTLVLLKLPQRQVDGEKVKALIKEMERTIGVPNPRDSKGSKAEINVEPDRVKWKAIYLCGLLFQWLPLGEREGPIERIRERVQTLLRSEELLLAGDYNRCIEPLNIGALDLGAAIKPGEPKLKAFEVWTKGFPFSTLVGSVYARR